MAPEVLADQGYDGKKADVWSIGVILYVLLAGFLPFDEPTIVNLFAKIQSADFSYPSWFTPESRELLDRILVVDPAKRIPLKELRVHPWMHHTLASEESSVSTVPMLDLSGAGGAIDGSAMDQGGGAFSDEGNQEEEDSDGEDGTVDSVPATLNAFDLVAQCGGFVMNRLYTPLCPDNESRAGRKGGRFPFTSGTPPSVLHDAVVAAMLERGYSLYLNLPKMMLCKGSLLTPKVPLIHIASSVYSLSMMPWIGYDKSIGSDLPHRWEHIAMSTRDQAGQG